jgi:NADPH:quinone reductase
VTSPSKEEYVLGLVRSGRRRPPVEIVEFDDPTPAPNEALVAVEASSLNRGELDLLQLRDDGWRPGQDLAGRVVQAAADGSSPPVGTRVVALVENGAWAEYAAVPAARLAVLPDGVETSTAAALPLAGLTALRTVRLAGPVLGRELLVLGAGGGVGHLAVQLAVGAGAFVTAQVRPTASRSSPDTARPPSTASTRSSRASTWSSTASAARRSNRQSA